MSSINDIITIIQVILQFFASYISYKIYNYNRLSKAWLAVTVALILMAFRGITTFFIGYEGITDLSSSTLILDRIWFPFFITIFITWGLWTMMKNFERFEVVESKVHKKIRSLKKK